MKVLCLQDLDKQTFLQTKGSKTTAGNLFWEYRYFYILSKYEHRGRTQISSLNNLLIKGYKCDHFLLQHSFQKNLPMPDNLKHEERKVIFELHLYVQLVYY